MSERTKDFRLAQKQRKVQRAFRIRWIEHQSWHYSTRDEVLMVAKKMADNMQVCSTCCGNPRHFDLTKGVQKLTIQERRALEYLKHDLLEDVA